MLDAKTRCVVAVQERVAADVQFLPRFLRRLGWARADFLMVAHTGRVVQFDAENSEFDDDQGVLTGTIYLLQKHRRKSQREKLDRLRKSVRRDISRHLTHHQIVHVRDRVLGSISGARREGGSPDERGLLIPEAEFMLFRSGEFRIWFQSYQAPTKFKSIQRRPRKESAEKEVDVDEFIRDLSAHFFYFIRDIVHKHYHHASSSDALLPLMPFGVMDDERWRRETTYALGRAVLEARRGDDLLRYKRAQGIAAYADAFQAGLGAVVRTKGDFFRLEINRNQLRYDWRHLLASIGAIADQENWRHSARSQVFVIVLTVVTGYLALWFAISQVAEKLAIPLNINSVETKTILWIAKTTYQSPGQMIVVSALSAVLFYQMMGRGVSAIRFLERMVLETKKILYSIGVTFSVRLRKVTPEFGDALAAYASGIAAMVLGIAFIDVGLGLAGHGSNRPPLMSYLWRLVVAAWPF